METWLSSGYLRLDDQEVDDVHEVFEATMREDDIGVLQRDLLETADDSLCHVIVHELHKEPVKALVLDQRAGGFG